MWKKILIGFLVLIALLVGVAYLLPSQAHVDRSTVIDASPSQVFAHVSDLNQFNAWSPWFERDPNGEYKVEGPAGKGQRLSWKSDKDDVGSGTQTIVAIETDKSVKMDLDFGEMGVAHAYLTLEPADGKTKVTWGFDSDLGMNPISRYFGLMMDKWVGADYEKGLAKLKTLVEASAQPAP